MLILNVITGQPLIRKVIQRKQPQAINIRAKGSKRTNILILILAIE